MKRYILVFFAVLAVAARAGGEAPRALNTGVDAGRWEAVGRLDLGGNGFCTGALIAPDLVLTAAHCLFDRETQDRLDPDSLEFLAGWRNGRASAYRRIKRAVVHPEFNFSAAHSSERVRNDVALLQLARPIRNTRVQPFQTASRPGKGARIGVVSYARERSEAPSLQEMCDIKAVHGGVLVTSCLVDFGASGAPIFTFEADGSARIVSVVSAKAEIAHEKVSLGTALQRPLEDLLAVLERADAGGRNAVPDVARVIVGDPRPETGAKFVRAEE